MTALPANAFDGENIILSEETVEQFRGRGAVSDLPFWNVPTISNDR